MSNELAHDAGASEPGPGLDPYGMPLERPHPVDFDFVNDPTAYHRIVAKAGDGRVRKRPVAHRYMVLQDPMTFRTSSGVQHGDAGDIVIIGADHAWPVSRAYFAEHYDVVLEG